MPGLARLIQLARPRLRRLPRAIHPYVVERAYTADLKSINIRLKEDCEKHLFPRLKYYLDVNAHQDSLADDAYSAMEDFKVSFFRQFNPKELARIAAARGVQLDQYNQTQMARVIGVNAFGGEPWLEDQMATFALNNANLIKTVPDRFFNDLSYMMFNALRDGTPWEDIQGDLMDRFGVSDWNAERIARDQISKLNAGFNQFRQEDIGVEGYFWRGTLDDRERDSHVLHEGIRYGWDDPPADTGHPGEDILCRCWAEPDLAKFYE